MFDELPDGGNIAQRAARELKICCYLHKQFPTKFKRYLATQRADTHTPYTFYKLIEQLLLTEFHYLFVQLHAGRQQELIVELRQTYYHITISTTRYKSNR